MPKISNNSLPIHHKDIKRTFDIVIMYNQEYGFYAEIPSEFHEIVNHLSHEDCQLLFISKKYAKKHSMDNKYTSIITSPMEGQCLGRMKDCILKLMDKAITQRDVIIVFFNPKDLTTYNNHVHNLEHPQIGMQFGLTYAVETSVGEEKVYSIYPEGGYVESCIRKERKEISLYDKASTIIPDTPQNRETLEKLYTAFVVLNERLKEFTSSPEKLLKMISSNTKLLG